MSDSNNNAEGEHNLALTRLKKWTYIRLNSKAYLLDKGAKDEIESELVSPTSKHATVTLEIAEPTNMIGIGKFEKVDIVDLTAILSDDSRYVDSQVKKRRSENKTWN